MPQRLLTAPLTRFWSGLAFGVLNGFIVFRWSVFRPDQAAFECVTVGALLAGSLTLVRISRHGPAVTLAVVFGILGPVLSPQWRWSAAVTGLLLGLGVYLTAVIYDELARYGLFFGKFLIVGPLLGGVYLALAPITELTEMTLFNAVHPMLFRLALGIVIGEGVGLGIELVEALARIAPGRLAVSGGKSPGNSAT